MQPQKQPGTAPGAIAPTDAEHACAQWFWDAANAMLATEAPAPAILTDRQELARYHLELLRGAAPIIVAAAKAELRLDLTKEIHAKLGLHSRALPIVRGA